MSGKIWGRQECTGWPNRDPVWTVSALTLAIAATMAIWYYQYQTMWTPLDQPDHTKCKEGAEHQCKTL